MTGVSSAGDAGAVRRAGSSPLYDFLAADYDAHFLVPHRAAYDQLAWDFATRHLPLSPGLVIDVGCGSGRWGARFAGSGHRVVGIESAPEMAAAARRRLGPYADVIEQPMELVRMPPASADLVLAIGSLQYADDPQNMIQRFTEWVRPGGWVVVVVDSLVSLVRELFARGRDEEALLRMRTRRGRWVQHDLAAELHLLDAVALRQAFERAQLCAIEVKGLLVGWSLFGGEELARRLDADFTAQLGLERELSAEPILSDLGKHLYAAGQVPST